jgi:hypothetical protein
MILVFPSMSVRKDFCDQLRRERHDIAAMCILLGCFPHIVLRDLSAEQARWVREHTTRETNAHEDVQYERFDPVI